MNVSDLEILLQPKRLGGLDVLVDSLVYVMPQRTLPITLLFSIPRS
jgi:hypothetical protein